VAWDSGPGLGAAVIGAVVEVIGEDVAAIGVIQDGAGVAGVGVSAGAGDLVGDGIPSGIGLRTGMSRGGATAILTPTFMRILRR